MLRIRGILVVMMLAGNVLASARATTAAVPVPVPEQSLRAQQSRPALSGTEYTYGTDRFVVHYTDVGIDAVPLTDADGSGVPDWVEDVGTVMERVWDVEIDQLGWPAPLPDKGEGGDERFDVYLMELFSQNLAGYVSPDGGFVGDNPNTARTEGQAAYGFLVLENDFIDPSPPSELRVWPADQWLRIVASHEFNHMLQIAINGMHPQHWWYEATANWMETQVFPDLRDNLESAGAVFKSPDTCMLRYGGVNRVENELHWYGMWVFAQLLAETYGPEIVLDVWYRMADTPAFGPFDDVFAEYGTTFEVEMQRFARAVLLREFANGDLYPTARLQEAVDGPGEWTPVDGVQRYAMDYIELNLDAPYTITLASEDDGIEGMVIGVRGTTTDVFSAGRASTVDFGTYDHAYLIVLNQTRPPNEAGCATARYTYTVQEPEAEAAFDDPELSESVPYFTPPQVEPVTDPEDIVILDPFYETELNINEEIQEVDVPFDPITPRGAPGDYELDSVYGVDADTLGEDFVALNAPSGGVVVQMQYYNSAGDLIRITESPTIYLTIGEWLAVNRLEFASGTEIWTSGTVDTAIVDPSGSGANMVVFIVKERFIVIDGDAPREDMLDMAWRFASSF